MQKKNILSYIGLGLAVAGTAGFIFLYFYPYESVNFEMIKNQAKDLSSLGLTSSQITTTSKDYETYTSSFSSYLISSTDEYDVFIDKANVVSSKSYDENFFEKKDLITLSLKGSFTNYSKAIKLSSKNQTVNLTIGVEGDTILTQQGSVDENIYTYYLIPINNSFDINTLNLIFSTI